jgi:hypothetical protein
MFALVKIFPPIVNVMKTPFCIICVIEERIMLMGVDGVIILSQTRTVVDLELPIQNNLLQAPLNFIMEADFAHREMCLPLI